jgi:hypothetical protein
MIHAPFGENFEKKNKQKKKKKVEKFQKKKKKKKNKQNFECKGNPKKKKKKNPKTNGPLFFPSRFPNSTLTISKFGRQIYKT